MRKWFEIGGYVAAVVLIAFGVGALVLSFNGRSTVNSSLKQQQIVGTSDMTPAGITAEAKKAGLKNAPIPSCSVAGKRVDNGSTARCFAQYMTVHALEATGGLYYSQMPRYASANGKGTNDATKAIQVNGQPEDNPARDVWIQETALSTALNTSYLASQLGLFGIVVGIALLLSGFGFGILAIAGALRNEDSVLAKSFGRKTAPTGPAPSVHTA